MIDRLGHAFFVINKNIKISLITKKKKKKKKKTYVTISNVSYRRDIIFMYRNVSYKS